jgi:hypothetical protein
VLDICDNPPEDLARVRASGAQRPTSPPPSSSSYDRLAMDQKQRAILGVTLTAVALPGLIYLIARPSQEQRIRRHGLPAEATIVRMVDQHETRHDHRPLMRITVEGDWSGAHHTAHAERRIDDDELDRFVVGAHVEIRYDREEPSSIVVLEATAADPGT